jgi:hypothetical protein
MMAQDECFKLGNDPGNSVEIVDETFACHLH